MAWASAWSNACQVGCQVLIKKLSRRVSTAQKIIIVFEIFKQLQADWDSTRRGKERGELKSMSGAPAYAENVPS